MLTELSALLDVLRAKGVARYEGAVPGHLSQAVKLDLGPLASTVGAPPVVDAGNESVSDKCRCGHEHHEHSAEGLCLHACEPEKCAPLEVTDAP